MAEEKASDDALLRGIGRGGTLNLVGAVCQQASVLGTILQWQLPRRRMSLEEHMKDGKITEVQVVRRLKFHHAFAPFLTICGAVILIAAFLIYAE